MYFLYCNLVSFFSLKCLINHTVNYIIKYEVCQSVSRVGKFCSNNKYALTNVRNVLLVKMKTYLFKSKLTYSKLKLLKGTILFLF